LTFCLSGVCPVRHVLREIKDDKCGVIALVDLPYHDDCPVAFGTVDPIFIQNVNGLVYSVPHGITARLSCKGKWDRAGDEGVHLLEGIGVVSIPNGCDLLIDKPEITLQGPVFEVFRSITSLDIIQTSFDSVQWAARAIDLSHNLTQVTQKWITNTVKERTWTFYLMVVTVTLVLSIVVCLIAVKLICVAKSYRKWKYSFKDFKELIQSEARGALHMAHTLWSLLSPNRRAEAAHRYITTAQEGTPPLDEVKEYVSLNENNPKQEFL
jgi:hypothetical protein